tara:strand:- start:678 stop:1427 length:750 start_codon:yes stop_codon:yes gene_type:complete
MIIGLIPARLNSKRLPNKPLRKLDGLPIIIHVLKRALMSKKLDKVIVCADDQKIIDLIKKFQGSAFLTNKNIKNGTERISIYLKKNIKKFKKLKLIVDIQCDEVFLNPKYIDKIINFHLKNIKKFDVVIPHSLTYEKKNHNYVKIISNSQGKVLYLSRSDCPHSFRSSTKPFKRHMDFITFKPEFLKKFNNLKERKLENYEGIELLRVLENGFNIGTIKMIKDSFSINTKEDFKKSIYLMKKSQFRKLY